VELRRLTPAAPARLHLLLAALLWTVVGAALTTAGTFWLLGAAGRWAAGLLVLALAIGVLKAVFVLGRTAQRTVARIRTRGDGRCIGGFLSWRSWLFVVAMMLLGRWLRGGAVPRGVVGFVYSAVGPALVVASARLWGAWWADRTLRPARMRD
jgi:hypothetical protein